MWANNLLCPKYGIFLLTPGAIFYPTFGIYLGTMREIDPKSGIDLRQVQEIDPKNGIIAKQFPEIDPIFGVIVLSNLTFFLLYLANIFDKISPKLLFPLTCAFS